MQGDDMLDEEDADLVGVGRRGGGPWTKRGRTLWEFLTKDQPLTSQTYDLPRSFLSRSKPHTFWPNARHTMRATSFSCNTTPSLHPVTFTASSLHWDSGGLPTGTGDLDLLILRTFWARHLVPRPACVLHVILAPCTVQLPLLAVRKVCFTFPAAYPCSPRTLSMQLYFAPIHFC